MNRRVITVAIASTLGLLAVWYLLLWSPQSTSLKKAQAAVAASAAKEQDLNAQVVSLQRQRAKLPAMRAQLAQILLALPKSADADKLINDVNAAASHSGVLLSSFTPTASPGALAGSLSTVSLGLSVTGTYPQVIDFVNRLNAMPRLAVVDGMSMSTPDAAGKMTVSINARVFVQPPPAKPVATTPSTTKGAP